MGIPERREREKTERRKAILNCARELILERGVERVSIEDIARKVELSKATVYLYFPGKEVIFSEICEEAARVFLERFKPFLETGVSGIAALKCFWRCYVELFGSSDEMIIVFKVYGFLNSGVHDFLLKNQSRSTHVDAILDAMKVSIDQCKADGIFDPNLDSVMATRLLLSVFSIIVENAARIPREMRNSPIIIEEMTNVFQIIIRGMAKEDIDRSRLEISFGTQDP